MTGRFLPTPLRRALERVVKNARLVAEAGAADAVRRLGVADASAPSHLDETGKDLRRRLRAHARTLGDEVNDDGTHDVRCLVEATGYAQWHRRLFARFLAERGLLRHPEHGPVTLEDCEELAKLEGFPDAWMAAQAYGARMLPGVFQPDDPVLSLEFAPEHVRALRGLVDGLDSAVFQADDALGWTYQFWRAAEKDAVNKSGGKIGAAELPAVTQLFTEPYMVRFLLHNTLGAWRAGKILEARPKLAAEAADEDELRAAVALPGYDFDMLRFVREGEDAPRWRPAAGSYSGWPKDAAALSVLDPCCGSGHFLTEALTIMAGLRAEEEGLKAAEAAAAVLQDNLFGLEIDGRCVQIAAFAVALTAWKVGGFQPLPAFHVAWVGAPPPLPKPEFLALANGDAELTKGLDNLWEVFAQAPLLGSLIEPTRGDLVSPQRLGRIEPLLEKLVEKTRGAEPIRAEGAVAALGMAEAAGILVQRFTLLVTNPPFLTEIKYCESLDNFLSSTMSDARRNLSTAMMERMFRAAADEGVICSVAPQSWLQLKRYGEFRQTFGKYRFILGILKLGQGAFVHSNSNGEAICLTIALRSGGDFHDGHFLIEAGEERTPNAKADLASDGPIEILRLASDARSAARFGPRGSSIASTLATLAESRRGISTSDSQRFIRRFWEPPHLGDSWTRLQSTNPTTTPYGGATDAVFWENECGELAKLASELRHLNHDVQNWRRGKPLWGKMGVVVSQMAPFNANIYCGDI